APRADTYLLALHDALPICVDERAEVDWPGVRRGRSLPRRRHPRPEPGGVSPPPEGSKKVEKVRGGRGSSRSVGCAAALRLPLPSDRKSTRLDSSHVNSSYA